MTKVQSEVVRRLMDTCPQFDSPVAAMRHLAAECLEEYFAFFPETGLPMPMRVIASFRNIEVMEKTLPPDIAGRLYVQGGRFIAEISQLDSRGRQNFTIGHEISHTLIPGAVDRKFRAEKYDYWHVSDGYEEYLCDIGASELVMPTRFFASAHVELGLKAESIPRLKKLFDTSFEAAAIRMVQSAGRECAVIVSERMFKLSQLRTLKEQENQLTLPGLQASPQEKALRVKWVSVSPGFAREHGYIPKNASIPKDSSIAVAHATGEPICKEEVLSIKEFSGRYKVDTIAVMWDPEGEKTKTFSLLIPA